MFLKMDTYFLSPNTSATIQLFNGTFDKSDNVITRDRMNDVSLVGNGIRTKVDTTQWTEKEDITLLNFKTGTEGTWVAGVSTDPRDFEQTAESFNKYLKHDGVFDMLDWRKQNDALDKAANERYSKHVKTIFQVGERKTDDWQTVLDYPIEFVPMTNPYTAKKGGELSCKLLWKGQPLPNHLVYVGSGANGHDHSHDDGHEHEGEDHHHDATQLRTDANGIVTMQLPNEGLWYLRTIYMEQVDHSGLTHESNWATLTFQVGHNHQHADGAHSHDHDHAHGHSHGDGHTHGLPSYAYWVLGTLLLVGILFWLKKKS
ncbi:MAG: DUF4198 domain-containing protein [Bacteroidota bacterium]